MCPRSVPRPVQSVADGPRPLPPSRVGAPALSTLFPSDARPRSPMGSGGLTTMMPHCVPATAPRAHVRAQLRQGDGIERELPARWSYAGSVFRARTPRPLRLLEFRQAGVELLGASHPTADLEVLTAACDAAHRLKVPDWRLHLGHAALFRSLIELLGDRPPATQRALANGLVLAARMRTRAELGDRGFSRYLQGTLQTLSQRARDWLTAPGGRPTPHGSRPSWPASVGSPIPSQSTSTDGAHGSPSSMSDCRRDRTCTHDLQRTRPPSSPACAVCRRRALLQGRGHVPVGPVCEALRAAPPHRRTAGSFHDLSRDLRAPTTAHSSWWSHLRISGHRLLHRDHLRDSRAPPTPPTPMYAVVDVHRSPSLAIRTGRAHRSPAAKFPTPRSLASRAPRPSRASGLPLGSSASMQLQALTIRPRPTSGDSRCGLCASGVRAANRLRARGLSVICSFPAQYTVRGSPNSSTRPPGGRPGRSVALVFGTKKTAPARLPSRTSTTARSKR